MDGTAPLTYSAFVHDGVRNDSLVSMFHPWFAGLTNDADYQLDGEAVVCQFGGVQDPESGVVAVNV